MTPDEQLANELASAYFYNNEELRTTLRNDLATALRSTRNSALADAVELVMLTPTVVPVGTGQRVEIAAAIEVLRDDSDARVQGVAVEPNVRGAAADSPDASYIDKNGTVWHQPTAWAYAQACKALHATRAERDMLSRENRALKHDLDRQMTIANEHVNEAYTLRQQLAACEEWKQTGMANDLRETIVERDAAEQENEQLTRALADLALESGNLRQRVRELEGIVDEAYRLTLVIESTVRWHEPKHYPAINALVKRIIAESRERVLANAAAERALSGKP